MKALLFTLTLLAGSSFAATPAENAIRQAAAAIEKQPTHFPYYNALAMACARRERETGDTRFYAKAEEALQKSFALAPDNYDGQKVETALLLGRHEFAKALEMATRLNHQTPDDVIVYGYIADADIELGNYKDAVAAVQWMLDLRTGNFAGLARAAHLRELHGNLSGALDLMQMAYDAAPPAETEDRAWVLAQMSHLELAGGHLVKAEAYATSALTVFPDYHYGLAALAQVRLAQVRYPEAVALFEQRYTAAPSARNLYPLAEAQQLAEQKEAATHSFARFEEQSRAESTQPDNSNPELIAYYAGHAGDPAKALALARREMDRRHDVFTLDGYAWALEAGGDHAAADIEIQKALALGGKDPKLLYHAGMIALHLQRTSAAKAYWKDATAGYSHEAEQMLRSLPDQARVN